MPTDPRPRDPSKDPKPGDMWYIGSTPEGVTYRQVRSFLRPGSRRPVSVWQRIGGLSWTLEKIAREDWERWTAHAEVIHAAD